jgi:hypothetical protein
MTDERRYGGLTAEEARDTAIWLLEHYKSEPGTEERDVAQALIDALDRIGGLEKELDDLHYDYLGADADRKHLEDEVVPRLKAERDKLRTKHNSLAEIVRLNYSKIIGLDDKDHAEMEPHDYLVCAVNALGQVVAERDRLRKELDDKR